MASHAISPSAAKTYQGSSAPYMGVLRLADERFKAIEKIPFSSEDLPSAKRESWAWDRVSDSFVQLLPRLVNRIEREFDPDETEEKLRLEGLSAMNRRLLKTNLYKGELKPVDEALAIIKEENAQEFYVFIQRTMHLMACDQSLIDDALPGYPPILGYLMRPIEESFSIKRFGPTNYYLAAGIIELARFALSTEKKIAERYPHLLLYPTLLDRVEKKIDEAKAHLEAHATKNANKNKANKQIFEVFKTSLQAAQAFSSSHKQPVLGYLPAKSSMVTIGDLHSMHHTLAREESAADSFEKTVATLSQGTALTTKELFYVLHRENVRLSADMRKIAYELYNECVPEKERIPHLLDQGTTISLPELMAKCMQIALKLCEEGKEHLKPEVAGFMKTIEHPAVSSKTLFLPLHDLNVAMSRDFRADLYVEYNKHATSSLSSSMEQSSSPLDKEILWNSFLKTI